MITDISFDQCISFFDVASGNHIGTYKIGFNKFNPQLQVSYPDYFLRRSFLWSKNSSGVYVITHDKALFLAYDSNFVIIEVDSVPERPINTNSGNISNNGKLLQVAIDGNRTSLNIVQLDDWIPFDSLELIPKETNTYSLY